MFGSKQKRGKLNQRETEEGRIHREKIINDAQAMKRLCENPDFKIFCSLLEQDKAGLIRTLLNEAFEHIMTNEQNVRLKARIQQIDRVLKKPSSLVWQMENLTEVRGALKEQTRRGASPR